MRHKSTAPPPPPPPRPVMDPFPWTMWTRRVVIILLIVAFIFFATFLTSIIPLLIIASIFAYIMFMPVSLLTTHTRLTYRSSGCLVLLVTFVVGGFIILNVGASFTAFVTQLAADAQVAFENAGEFLMNYTPDQGVITSEDGQRSVNLNPVLQPLSELVQAQEQGGANLGEFASASIKFVAGTVTSLFELVANLLVIFILGAVLLMEFPSYYRWMIRTSLEPARRQNKILLLRSATVWHNYFRSSLIVAGTQGLLTTIQFFLMGLPDPIIIGIITAFLFLIPIIGGFIALIPISLVPLLHGSSTLVGLGPLELTALVLAVNFVIQIFVWNVVQPIVTLNAVKLPVAVYLLGIMIGSAVGGALGAFLILPLLAIGREMLEFTISKLQLVEPYPGEAEPVFGIESLLLPKSSRSKDDSPVDQDRAQVDTPPEARTL